MFKKIKLFFSAILFGQSLKGPIVIVLSFHRISVDSTFSCFSKLATIKIIKFKLLILFCKLIGTFIAVEDLYRQKYNKKRLLFLITFDDVSSTVTGIIKFIERFNLPITIFPCAYIINNGFGWRDKIYYLASNEELSESFVNKAKEIFPIEARSLTKDQIYSWSKSTNFSHKKLVERVIDAVLIGEYLIKFKELVQKNKPYLSWDQLRDFSHHRLITIGNHSFSHFNFATLATEEIVQDLSLCHEAMIRELGMEIKFAAIPFGKFSAKVYDAVNNFARQKKYKVIFWVQAAHNNFNPTLSVEHLVRIHMSGSLHRDLMFILGAIFKPNRLHNSIGTHK